MRRRCVEMKGGDESPMAPGSGLRQPQVLSRGRDMDHEVVATETGYCSSPWEADTLRFMADNLVFEQP